VSGLKTSRECAPPTSDDTAPPRVEARIAPTKRPLTTGGIVIQVRCPDHDCLAGATVAIGTRMLAELRASRAPAASPPSSSACHGGPAAPYGRGALRGPA
jgi:hypothetical protein